MEVKRGLSTKTVQVLYNMAKEKKQKIETKIDPFKELRSKIKTESQVSVKMPSILDFVDSDDFLGLTHSNPPIHLYDLQKLVLKCFYRGSDGNENLTLSPEDIILIEKNKLNEVSNGCLLDKWKSGNHFRELVLVWGRRCLSENSEIVDTETGKVWQLGELWNYGKKDISSWTYDESLKKMINISGCNLVYQGKREVFKIQTVSGHEIEATDNHPMMTDKGWVEVKNLRPKDKIAISLSQPFFGSSNELKEDEASILGYLSSNSFDSTSCYISTILNDGDVFEDFKKKAASISSEIKIESADNYNIKSNNEKKYNYVIAQKATAENSEDSNIITFIKNNGLKNKTGDQKFVPTRIFTSPKKIVASYLRSLFSCDNYVSFSNISRFSSKIEIFFSSLVLVKQVQHLLSRFGIFSSFQSKLVNKKTEHILSISKNSYVKLFVNEIGFIGKKEFEKEVKENVEIDSDFSPIVFSPIFSIKKIGIKKTFDLQVSDKDYLQNFVSNGFICHNCISEDGILTDARTGERFTFKQAWEQEKIVSSWTYDENKNQMVIVDDCNIIKQERRMVYKITDSFGNQIEVTDNHPFLTQRGWVETKDLQTGDSFSISTTLPLSFGNSDAISENEAAILGYITGDGCCSKGSVFFTAKNEEIRKDLESRLNLLSDNLEIVQDIWTKADSKKYAYKVRSKNIEYENFKEESVLRTKTRRKKNDLVKLLEKHDLMGKTCHDKCVPNLLWNCPKNVIAAYLKHLFSCDGWVMLKKVKNKVFPCIGFATSNGRQAIAVAQLLSKFGIICNIRKKKCNTKIFTEGKLYEYKNTSSFELYFLKRDYILLFIDKIGFIGKDKNTINQVKMLAEKTKGNITKCKNTIFTDFVSKESLEEKQTFDLQVSDQKHLQNFVCNNYIVSNSGKDFLTSIIALYEAMRLLETPGGNPYKTYNLASATPFTILTIANSSTQAQVLFREIKDKVLRSDYFKDKIIPEGVTSDSIHFLTPEDKRRNEELVSQGHSPGLGSIVVKSGHSNSDSLVGISCYVLLLDEIGLYKNTAGSSSGDAIYNSLGPAVKTYVREVPKLDSNCKPIIGDNGVAVTEKIYDGKIICLSTPRGKGGIFFELYNNHQEVNHRLVCRAATWQVNPMQTKEGLMASFPDMPEEKFSMEFGAEFSGTAGVNFFNETDVDYCFQDKSLKFRDFGVPGMFYFAHLDPATSSHNYALVLAHKEVYFDFEAHKREWKIVVDHIKYWSPSPNNPISVEEVDNYVADLNFKFCIGLVTYDHFNSQTSIVKLRKKGIPTKMTAYTKQYKNIIYDNLYQLVIQKRLCIPNHLLLKNEMKSLQRKYTDNGYKVYPKKDGDVTTDDITDALAGACYNCIEKELNRLPQGKLVSLPVQGTSDIVWRSMSGQPYGVGSGQQVAKKMEERSSLYRRGM